LSLSLSLSLARTHVIISFQESGQVEGQYRHTQSAPTRPRLKERKEILLLVDGGLSASRPGQNVLPLMNSSLKSTKINSQKRNKLKVCALHKEAYRYSKVVCT